MAVAFDASSAHSGAAGVDLTWTHTPTGTPRGIIVFVNQVSGSTDEVIGVTYGGVAMTEIAGSPNSKAATEVMVQYAYFLGSNIPTGAQTITVDVNATGSTKHAQAYSLTASADTEVVDSDATINSGSVASPTCTLSLGGRTCFACIGFGSGQGLTTGISPNSGWTDTFENDFSSQTCGQYRFDTIGTSDVTAGWTQAADDAVAIAVAVAEVLPVFGPWVTPALPPIPAPAVVSY